MHLLPHVVRDLYFAFAACNQPKGTIGHALREQGVLGQDEYGLHVIYYLFDDVRVLKRLRQYRIILDSVLKDELDDLEPQAGRDEGQELRQLRLVIEATLRLHQELPHLQLYLGRQLHILHRCVRNIQLLLKQLHFTVHALHQDDQITKNVSIHETAHKQSENGPAHLYACRREDVVAVELHDRSVERQ